MFWPPDDDRYTRPKQEPTWTWSPVAGHCGKCGAPYTMDMMQGIGPVKFIPSCQCWNVPREHKGDSDA